MEQAFSEFKEKISYLSENERKKVIEAAEYAMQAHSGQKRVSGEMYAKHPILVASILGEMQQDQNTIIAGLLHDVIEDANITPAEIRNKYGEEVEFLVNSVTKISEYRFKSAEAMQAENIRKMLLSMAKDLRVIIIKIADRLHNMRTLNYLPREKQLRIAQETLEIYTPLAHRLGMGLVKWELEDLCLRYLEPEVFAELKQKVSEKREDRERYTRDFIEQLSKILEEARVKGEISGRAKHFYSIYQKMKTQNLTFNEIFDLIAVRVISKNNKDCYSILGLIHSHWKPLQGKIKDYIAMPKGNMYQSLHTTILGPGGRPVEVQIRTSEMHEIAEYGVAAHWLYKAIDKSKHGKKKLTKKETEYLDKLSWMRKLMEMQASDNPDAKEFLENLKTDFLINEIFVFSPLGDVYSLPEGSTPVDFAFTIHSAIGFSCTGARVNGKLVPLSHELKNGDIVEILRGKGQNPNPDWLKFVKTSHTKNKIKNFLNKQMKEQKVSEGKEFLQKELRSNTIAKADFKKQFPELLDHYQMNEDDFYYALAKGDVSSKVVIDYFKREEETTEDSDETKSLVKAKAPSSREKSLDSSEIVVEGDTSNIMFSMAKCCNPVFGDEIIGVISRKKGISVHRADCPNIQNLREKKIEVSWAKSKNEHKYLSQLTIIGYDRVGWFKDVLNLIAEKKINVKEAYANHKGSVTKAKLLLEVTDNKQLKDIMIKIRQMKDIYEVYRT